MNPLDVVHEIGEFVDHYTAVDVGQHAVTVTLPA